jgi:proline dehydrogenase
MLDAEQSYLQPAIDDLALGLGARFNAPLDGTDAALGPGPVISNTYQMYLKDALSRLQQDTERAQRAGRSFSVKIVRGAYMETERRLALEQGTSCPVHDTQQDTHASYNAAIHHLLPLAARPGVGACTRPLSFVVASHNAHSALLATHLMREHGLPPGHASVGFAQLLGMKDGLSGYLAAGGYSIYKYIPYGPLAVTIPYLQRRAVENSAVLGAGVNEDLGAVWRELALRLRGGAGAAPAAASAPVVK